MSGRARGSGATARGALAGALRATLLAPPALAALAVLAACAGRAGTGPVTVAGPETVAADTVPAAFARRPVLLDGFEVVDAWTAAPASGVEARVAADTGRGGGVLRFDFDFHGRGGWAAFRRPLVLDLPENYELSFWIRGDAPLNTLEFKLVDESGENVWWVNRRDFEFPGEWRKVTYRKRHVRFAWGPAGGGDLRRTGALELAITAGTGGAGTVWLDRLELTPLEPVRPYDLVPVATATSSAAGAPPELALDADTATAWRSAGGGRQRLTIDFLRAREYGGVVVEWVPGARARDYDVQVSGDGVTWETVRSVRGGGRARDHLFLPETESRFLRLDLLAGAHAGAACAIRGVEVRPVEWAASRNTLFEEVAALAPRGDYPRTLLREQSYWTVVGAPGDEKEALINEEGLVEVDRRAFSIEPFLLDAGRLITWADARTTPSLEQGWLPVPSVRWDAGRLALTITAWADGEPGASTLWLRYRVENRGTSPAAPTLFLALRPFQVNAAWQFLNNPGGAATVREIAYAGGVVRAEGRRIIAVSRPAGFGAAAHDEGNVVDWLRRGELPPHASVSDAFGHASAALAYPLELGPGAVHDIYLAAPFHTASPPLRAAPDPHEARALAEARLAATIEQWRDAVERFEIRLPPGAPPLGEIVKSNVAYILINRDAAAIQPGTRSYERSWIRDGSLTSAALLRLGHADIVRDFALWYAPFQYADGKVPCCVDRHGAGAVPEHDSHGQLIYLAAEYFRHTGDRATLDRLWPHVVAAANHIDMLRRTRLGPEYDAPEKLAYRGMLPPSISHEGYSAKPMHSYWDGLFALRGLADAAFLAGVVGDDAAQRRFAALRDEFRRDLVASLQNAMAFHGIDYLPGCVELGDFDATSTTVAVTPVGAAESLPAGALERTFEKYWENFIARRDGTLEWKNYTPYEWRTVGTFVRLGERRRALEALDWFLAHRRPAAWNHWAEVVWRDPLAPEFIGDMPHGWVGSDFIRSVLDLFAYEREADDALVLGAGIAPAWVSGPGGVRVRGLRTHHGTVGYDMSAAGDEVTIRLARLFRAPRGGLIIRSPLDRPVRAVLVDGRQHYDFDANAVRLDRVPERIVLRY